MIALALALAATTAHGPVYHTAPPMDATVRTGILPRVEVLLQQLLRERRAMTLGGVEVFKSGDKFLPGKIAWMMSERVLSLPAGDPRLPQRLAEFADIAALTVADPNDSWGRYYYVSALLRLHRAGLLTRAVRPDTLAALRRQLDWRGFVSPDYRLIDLPNNYYGVAFSIARMRFLLGWDAEAPSLELLRRMLDHYRRYSGSYGFADETEGKGRYDRYSVLLVAEIAHHLMETGLPVPNEVKGWLKRSANLMLLRANLSGEGWEYGRSIGTYGETAALEVLATAARLKLLTPLQERMAYAYSARISARYADFWTDAATGSVDMWGAGRRTDAYRGKHRIFGENLSLARQHLYTSAIWDELGYRGKAPDAGYAAWVAALPKLTTTWFARGEHDRALVTMRDGPHLISLPLINGAEGQHMNTPYFPAPFSPGLLQGSADARYPHLVPQITLSDGTVLLPLAWFRDVKVTRAGSAVEVSWRQDALDRTGGNDAVPDPRVTVVTRYRFTPGRIERSDQLAVKPDVRIASIATEFASFSGRATGGGTSIRFGQGEVTEFATTGYGACQADAPPAQGYGAPTGGFATLVRCSRTFDAAAQPPALTWSLSYNSREHR